MSRTQRIPRRRLHAGGPGGDAAVTWAMRVAAIALVLALAVLAWAFLRPLESHDIALGATEPPAAPTPHLGERLTLDQRQSLIDDLARESSNPFSVGRTPWLDQYAVEDGAAENETADASDTDADPDRDAPPAQANPPRGPERITIMREEDLPSDVRTALQGLVLSGIYAVDGDDARGFAPGADPMIAARISFKHGTRVGKLLPAITVIEGDRFYDPHIKDEKERNVPWDVLRIDEKYDRVILRRDGRNAALAMYDFVGPETVEVAENAPPARVRPEDIRIVDAAPEQIDELLKLLEQEGTLTNADLDEINRLLAGSDEAKSDKVSLSGLLNIKPANEPETNDAPPAMPAAITEVMKAAARGASPEELRRIAEEAQRKQEEAAKKDEGDGDGEDDGES